MQKKILILTLILLVGCTNIYNVPFKQITPDVKLIECFSFHVSIENLSPERNDIKLSLLAINNDHEYLKLKNYKRNISFCDDLELPFVDFSKNTLLADIIVLECATFNKSVIKDESLRTYTLIKLRMPFQCRGFVPRGYIDLMTIPKIQEGYTVNEKIVNKQQ